MKALIQAILCYLKVPRVLSEARLWKWTWAPGLVSALYIPAVLIFGILYYPEITTYFEANWVPEFIKAGWIIGTIGFLSWLTMVGLAVILYRNLILILFSPILCYLSEKVESHITGEPGPPFSMSKTLYDLWRAAVLGILLLVLSILALGIAFLFNLAPVVGGVLYLVLATASQFYFNGATLVDPTLERHGYRIRRSLKYMNRHKGRMLGLGTGFHLLLMIPILGWFLAPSFGVVAATLAVLKDAENLPPQRRGK